MKVLQINPERAKYLIEELDAYPDELNSAVVSKQTEALGIFSLILSTLFKIVLASFIIILLFLLIIRINFSGPIFIKTVLGGNPYDFGSTVSFN